MATGEPQRRTTGTATVPQKSYPAYEAPTATVKTDRSRLRNTEAGQSKAQTATVLAWEDKYRNRRTENVAFVDANGTLNPLGDPQVGSGSGSRVAFDARKIPTDAILMHNHPMPKNDSGMGARVGISLSGQDLKVASKYNAREVRAVTPNYVFSIKRPANGWGSIDPDKVNREFITRADQLTEEYKRLGLSQMRKGQMRDVSEFTGRINAVVSHTVMKELSKKYGFSYTRRKSS